MFKKSTPPTPTVQRKNQSVIPHTILGQDTNFEGTLRFDGQVRIEGRLKGEVITEDLCVLGQKAVVDGEVKVGTLIVHGRIEGHIDVSDLLELHPTAEVVGQVKAKQIVMHAGAQLNGQLTMKNVSNKNTHLKSTKAGSKKKLPFKTKTMHDVPMIGDDDIGANVPAANA